jgi:flagellar protein FliL
MLAVDSTDKTAKQKAESKPVVENKGTGGIKSKLPKLWIIFSALIIVILGILGYFIYPHYLGKGKSAEKTKKKVELPEEVKAAFSLEPFLVNLADHEEVHFVKATFKLGLGKAPDEEAKNDVVIAAIRDSIISLLSTKKAEQILTLQGKDQLRQEIKSRVNIVSPKLKVLEVYIVEFVVQL